MVNAHEGSSQERTAQRARRPSLFPNESLQEALEVALAIRDSNAGRPYNRILLAQAMNRTPSSSAFRTLITSSAKYSLTDGSYNSETIALTDLGRLAVYPRTEEEKALALRQAATYPSIFANFYTRFDNNKFPREDLVLNTLQVDFGVPHDLAKRCLELLKVNGEFAGILRDVRGSTYVMIKTATPSADAPMGTQTLTGVARQPGAVEAQTPPGQEPPPEELGRAERAQTPMVFISHSKNSSILEQLKTILKFGGFEWVIAEEEETPAIPVPIKVLEAMRRCNAAIINISADPQEGQPDGRFGVNQNVLIETGAAFVLYYPRIILLVDQRVALPSNLQGLYRCDYTGEELSWSVGMKLQDALSNFRESLAKGASA